MPYVMATLGLHRPDGSSRKADHDHFNEILNNAYNAVVSEVAKRFDPVVGYTNPGTVADNLVGLELVKGWREGVWRNAERLLNAKTPDDRAAVENSIETNAATSARAIASVQLPPGYRSSRDAYCAAHLAATPAPASHSQPKVTKPSRKSGRHRAGKHRRAQRRHVAQRRRVTHQRRRGRSGS